MKSIIMYAAVAAIIGSAAAYLGWASRQDAEPLIAAPSGTTYHEAPAAGESGAGSASFAPQENGEGGVTVVVTPERLSQTDDRWVFSISMNTHSIELDEDLMQAVVLRGEDGREYAPLSYDGPPGGGHHRSGNLAFAPILPLPKSLTVVIKGVGDVPERAFTWKL